MKGSPSPNINTHINTGSPTTSSRSRAETRPPLTPAEPRYEIVHVFEDHETRFGTYGKWPEAAERMRELAEERGVSPFNIEQSASLGKLSFHDGDHEIRLRPIR